MQKFKPQFSKVHFILPLILALATLLCGWPANAQTADIWNRQAEKMIFDFENAIPDEIEKKNCEISLTGQLTTHRKKALAIAFQGDIDFSGITIHPSSPLKLNDENPQCLVFDVTNTSTISIHLKCTVTGSNGIHQTRTAAIGAGQTTTCFFELNGKYVITDYGLRDDPNPYPGSTHLTILGLKNTVSIKAIKEIKLYTAYNSVDKSMVIDRIRLVASPPKPVDYLSKICDRFGQNTKRDYPLKIESEEELKSLADAEVRALAISKPMPDRSLYGGWKEGPRLESTGYFRTQKVDGQWALVDPDGYLYFSVGIANVRMANSTSFTGRDFDHPDVGRRDPNDVTPEDSKDLVTLTPQITATSEVTHPWRYDMFTGLPAYDDPLAKHYSYRYESHFGPVEHGETFSFYRANLERRYGEQYPGSYLGKWRDITLDRMIDWGFTSFGNWAAPEFYHSKRFPYFANGWIIGAFQTVSSGFDYWGPLPDVFDPEFTVRTKATMKTIADEVMGSPWCVGVFIDNEKSWGRPGSVSDRYGIVLDALSKPSSSSYIKRAFMDKLNKKYNKIDALNRAWQSSYSDWDALKKGVDLRSMADYPATMVEDFSMLLEYYASTYFKIVHDELEAVLPHHMYMGCRFASWGMNEEIRKGATKYVDVFSYNYYKEAIGERYWEFLEEIDMPSIIGEFHMGTIESGLFHPGLVHGSDLKDRARMFKTYVNRVIDNPYFVGVHWFQYIDSPLTGRAHDGENYNTGFVTTTDVPYPEMIKAAKDVNSKLYTRKYGSQKPGQ